MHFRHLARRHRAEQSGLLKPGLMVYCTLNNDRIAAEGFSFTDYRGEQSCTVGRAAFIAGRTPVVPGWRKVGMRGAEVGLRSEDPTIAFHHGAMKTIDEVVPETLRFMTDARDSDTPLFADCRTEARTFHRAGADHKEGARL